MSRLETLLTAMLNGEQIDIEPRSRMEQYLKNCCDKCGCDGLPTPRSRAEVLLYQLAEQLAGSGGVETQEKTVDITENGTTEITADEGYLLSKVTANVNVPTDGDIYKSGLKKALEHSTVSVEITAEEWYGVTSIRSYAFYNCSAYITKIDFPNTLETIGLSAFQGSSKLKEIALGTGLKTVGTQGFQDCTALETVIIKSKRTDLLLNNDAFCRCTKLKRVVLHSETPPTIQSNTFRSVPTTCIYEVPADSVEAYKAATNWSTLADQIVASEEF